MALRRVEVVLTKGKDGLPGVQGIQGLPGQPGKNGITTTVKEVVHVQEEGKPGKDGTTPEHEVRNGEIRFKNPDGTWGKWVEVQPSSSGGGGSNDAVKYTAVQAASFRVVRTALIAGTNIFGVNFVGAVEIILPSGIDKNIIIIVKDESNAAVTNNITITTENQ